MTSERVQRQIDRLLDEAEAALGSGDWATARLRAEAVLRIEPGNADATTYLQAATRDDTVGAEDLGLTSDTAPTRADTQPASFASGRYSVTRFLGEGGKKRVYLAHDAQLDRDVAFALIKTEGLDEAARARITREAQAMGRLGSHPHIVTVYDIGEENGQPYLVLPVLPGGDVEGVIEGAEDHKLSIEQAIKIATETCLGLEFSHSKGIIHRDLKPGNVWLAEDGRAMIGDFGLAVAADRSRLTQAGMMVGTVNYMPPEQAMGGQISPRSDLYSLGAMLYEMVCGRPPFVGDESVAIIGQHLNTPPVAPTWHRPDCPPGLEALILRLLEKDPERRPGSATDVREALSSISAAPSAPSVHEEVTASHQHDPLYRRVFVGRENELRLLQQAYDAAVSGQGGLVMVVGEPGIGKTSVVEQLATYVQLRGGRTLVGHCYEEGSLSLPYLPFVEAMRSYVLDRDPEALRSDLGSGASEVARIVSEVRDKVNVSPREAGDPEEQRWRLMEAVTGFLRNAASVQPLVIVLEDLHWSDRGTLDLLLHTARNLEGARLVLLGTYRDVEVDRAHPLSAALAELRRIGAFTRLPLRGLSIDEVHRMYEAIRGQSVQMAQAELVYRQTEGNPLFIQEFLRYLVEEGIVYREDGRYQVRPEDQASPAVLPEGLRDVVGRRLSRLSTGCNRLLAIAAVIGRDFDLDTLRSIASVTEDELLEAVEEAVRVGVLEERSLPGAVRYRFAHAFFRQSLYEEMIAPRRLRLHQQVARALEEQYALRRDEHAAELAEHFGQSTDRSDLAKALEYGEVAAQRAMSVFAYAEAEAHLRRCLGVQEVLDPEDIPRRCDLLLAQGETMLPQEQPSRVAETTAEEAFSLAESLGDSGRAARAAALAFEALLRTGDPGLDSRPDRMETWAERARLNAVPGTRANVFYNIVLALLSIRAGQPSDVGPFLRKALDEAEAVGDNSTYYVAAGWAFSNMSSLRDLERRAQLAREIISRPRDGARSADVAGCLLTGGLELLRIGQRDEAEGLWKELELIAQQTNDATSKTQAIVPPVLLAFMNGLLEDAVAQSVAVETAREQVSTRTLPFRQPMTALFYLGRIEEVDEESLSFGPTRTTRAALALYYAYSGRFAEVKDITKTFEGISSAEDDTSAGILGALFQAALLGGDLETIGPLAARMGQTPVRAQPTLGQGFVSMARLLGEAAALLEKPEEARTRFDEALIDCERIGLRPDRALTRLDLAELLLDHYPDERDKAIEHLDFAIAEFRDMKMQPALERALGRRGLLKA